MAKKNIDVKVVNRERKREREKERERKRERERESKSMAANECLSIPSSKVCN